MSLSSRRAWIEIHRLNCKACVHSPKSLSSRRAWIEIDAWINIGVLWASLSSRRAWIEILYCNIIISYTVTVALLTESVDWNVNQNCGDFIESVSLSSRRAWIEIIWQIVNCICHIVALLTESVDWNNKSFTIVQINILCRSPHGERGLKCQCPYLCYA